MAVTVSTVGTHANEANATHNPYPYTNSSASITIGSSDTMAVVFITAALQGDSGTDLVATVTIGGVSATALTGSKKFGFAGTNADGFSQIFYIQNPASSPGTGSKTVAVTIDTTAHNGGSSDVNIHPVTYTGALAASPWGTALISAQNAVSSITATDTLSTGDLLVGIAANGTAAPGVTTGTSDDSITGGTFTGSANTNVAHNSGSGSVSIVWSTNSADESQYSAARLIAAGAGPPAVIGHFAYMARKFWTPAGRRRG